MSFTRAAIVALSAFFADCAYGGNARPLACEGIFGPQASHEEMRETFGAANVTFGEVWGEEGTFPLATVLFADDPQRRLAIVWKDVERRRTPAEIMIGAESRWSVEGLRTGMSVEEVEALNGKPFELGGFNDVDRGRVQDWKGGKLRSRMADCRIDVQFGYRSLGLPLDLDDPLESEGPYSSGHLAYRTLGARVTLITLRYPAAE